VNIVFVLYQGDLYLCRYNLITDMAKKSYKPQDNELPQVNEPVAAYHVTTPNANLYVPTEYEQEIIMHSEKDYEEGRLHTQEDVDKLVEQWLS
jgi:hypothetical protein